MTIHFCTNKSSNNNTPLKCFSFVKCGLINTAIHYKYNKMWFLQDDKHHSLSELPS
ncbi:hypothetical protein HanIR_Chr12g0560931 [Helianthus annuus]|nr:hypothetical protein HanIR_Chr12g0560931 [Helianthus annuus]